MYLFMCVCVHCVIRAFLGFHSYIEITLLSNRQNRSKMMHPAVQNDFSFYRRMLGRRNDHQG